MQEPQFGPDRRTFLRTPRGAALALGGLSTPSASAAPGEFPDYPTSARC